MTAENFSSVPRPDSPPDPWGYLVLAVGGTWLFWIPAALWGPAEPAALTLGLHYAGGLAPFAAALGLVYLRTGQGYRREFWQRLADPRRIGIVWAAIIFLTVPLLTGLAGWIDRLLGGAGARWEGDITRGTAGLLGFALFSLVFGPLPEEIGWRGLALDGLQRRMGALSASLALGVVWTIWHLPLFWIEGSYQNGLLGTPSALLYLFDKLPQSVLITWIFNNTHRSTLSAVLFHFMVNFTGELTALSAGAETLYILLLYAAAAAAVLISGPRRLSRSQTSEV